MILKNVIQKIRRCRAWKITVILESGESFDMPVFSGVTDPHNPRIPWNQIRNTLSIRLQTEEIARIDCVDQEGSIIQSITDIEETSDDPESEVLSTFDELPIPSIGITDEEAKFERFMNMQLKSQESNIRLHIELISAILKPIVANYGEVLKHQSEKIIRLEKQQIETLETWSDAVQAKADAESQNSSPMLEALSGIAGAVISAKQGESTP